MVSCSDSLIEQNGARPSYWRIVGSWSRRPVRTLCGYAWWPTSHTILSVGESSSECSATASSQVPRLAPKCPPIWPTVSMMCSRTSWATCTSSSSGRSWRSCGRSMRSRMRAIGGYRLRGAGEDEVGDLLELGRARRRGLVQRGARGLVALAGQVARAVDPEVADVRGLAHPLVAAARLAQRGVRAGDVEDVVDDLKEDAELGGEAAPGDRLGLVHAGQEQYADHGGADQAPGLQRVQAAQLLGRLPHPGHVEVLPTDHPVHAGGGGQLAGGGEHQRGLAGLLAEEMAEGLGVEAVAGEDGDVLAVLDVARRPP